MIGITSYGAYIPLHRLSRDAIASGLRGEKAIANFDEDSMTMTVAAVIDCLNGRNRQEVDSMFFASTTYGYKEKLGATTIAAATDMRRDIYTADFADSLRAGTTALKSALDAVKAGSAKQAMVGVADCRLGAPGSDQERSFGDGSAALLIGDQDVAVNIEASYSVSNEMMDVWRTEDDRFVHSWEERFVITEGYLKVSHEAISGVLNKCGLGPKDFAKVVFYAPDARRLNDLAKNLGFDPKTQVPDPMFDVIGNTGAAYPLMLLVSALEEAKPGDRILLAGYGNGSDAFVLQVTDNIEKIKNRRGMKAHLESKLVVNDYRTYLKWRSLINWQPPPRRSQRGIVSMTAMWREQEQIIPFHGYKCQVCGTIQYPPMGALEKPRLCVQCHAKDQFDHVRLSDRRGTLFSYALDYVSHPIDIPVAAAVIDFDQGGRFMAPITDRVTEELKVGMPLEMTFRKLYSTEDMHQYYWKAMPVRA